MSYIEQKYYKNIIEIFEELASFEKNVVKRLELKSLKEADDLAKLCADLNKKINLILKKYYQSLKQDDIWLIQNKKVLLLNLLLKL